MKKNNKKNFLLGLGLLSVLCLTGCGNKQQPAQAEPNEGAVTGTQSNNYSKADWIKNLGVKFGYMTYQSDDAIFSDVQSNDDYYAEVQACSEWGVITETDEFLPKEAVTWEYALDTAVRAIGVDDLSDAGYEITEEDSLSDFYLGNIAAVDISDLKENITSEEAEQVLAYAYEFENNLEFADITEITYQEGVKTVSEHDILLRGDGESAYLVGEETYDVGQVLLYSNTQDGTQVGLKVSEVNGNLINYTEAELSEIFSEINVRGSFDPENDSINISKADYQMINANIALYDASEQGRITSLIEDSRKGEEKYLSDVAVEVNIGSDSADFTVKGDKWSVSAGVKNVRASGECKYLGDVSVAGIGIIRKAKASISYDDYVHGEVAECAGKTFPLGTMSIPLDGGANIVRIQVDLILNIGADGEATIDYVSHVTASAEYAPFKGAKSSLDTTGASLDFHAEITATAEPTIRASLMLFDANVLNIQATTGIVAIAKSDVDFLGNQPACTDIHAYVPLRWAFNDESCAVTFLLGNKARRSEVVWDVNYSAFEWKWHFEDGTEVEACTRGQGEEVKAPVVDENGEPFDEEEKFEFQPIDFATIKLESSMMFLTKDETLKIGFKEVPQGQSTDTFVYEVVDNQGICQPNGNGTITGLTPGAANIKISTADGLYHAYITVVVQDDYTTEFNPL